MFLVGRPSSFYQRRTFFLCIAKAFWNHRHCRWFSLYKNESSPHLRAAFLCRHSLFSRPVARQVFSAIVSLTSVFGMGTGGPSRQSTPTAKKKPDRNQVSLCWHYLFSRSVTRQVSSAHVSLTSVFGMGTGGPSHQSAPTIQDTP